MTNEEIDALMEERSKSFRTELDAIDDVQIVVMFAMNDNKTMTYVDYRTKRSLSVDVLGTTIILIVSVTSDTLELGLERLQKGIPKGTAHFFAMSRADVMTAIPTILSQTTFPVVCFSER